MAYTDGNIIIGTSVDVGGVNTGLKKISNSINKLGKLVTLTLGVGAFAKLGKAALDAASDLQEVQNVVDVSFGDMAYKIENFASTAVEKFGMSEFAAKQTAGSYMAMGKSMGLTAEEASDMAVQLTALSGDMASFLNISQDYARVALSAVYTGETETMKRYGIILTEANLQQYATAKGLDVTVKKMDARDKALLRYMYIMENTKYMEGDFVRTQDSWANSTRILQEVWKQFLIALGDGLISVLTPLVNVLNVIIKKLTQFTQTLWVALSNIFGFSLQKLSNNVGDTADEMDALAENTDAFGKSVDKAGKKVHKQLANFDELNNITTQTNSNSGGSGGGLGLGDFELDTSPLTDPNNPDSPWSDIDNLYDLGKWIGDKLSEMMENIDWQSIYNKAWKFGQGLAEFLNGLISTDLFKDVGHTIAGALDTAVREALAFAWNFDWEQFGQKLADGVNEFFYTFDFNLLAQAINKWVIGIWTALKEFVKNVDWKAVLSGIGEFFSNLDPEAVAIILGFVALKKIIKLAVAESIFKAFKDGIAKGLGLKPGEKLIAPYIESLGFTIGTKFAKLKTVVATALTNLFPNAIGGTAGIFGGLLSVIGGLVMAVKNFFDMWKDGWSGLKTILEAIGIALAAVGAIILGAPAAIAAIVAGIVFAVSQLIIIIHDNWDSIKAWFAQIPEWFKSNVIDPVANFFTGIGEWFKTKVIDPVVNWIKKAWSDIKEFVAPIIDFFEGMFTRIAQFAEGCWIIIKAIWMVVSDFAKTVVDAVIGVVTKLWSKLVDIATKIWEGVKSVFSAVADWVTNNIINPVVERFNIFKTMVTAVFTVIWNAFTNVWNKAVSFISPILNSIINVFNSAVNTIKNAFTGLWNSITNGIKSAMNGLIGTVERAINFVINAINTFISGFNRVVSWAASITGSSWGGVSLIPNVSLPRLASGAVIPPNNEFLAVLGDQKSGTNIEAPLDTIKQAFMETLSGLQLGGNSDNQDIVVQIDGYEVFRAVRKQNTLFTKTTGVSAF